MQAEEELNQKVRETFVKTDEPEGKERVPSTQSLPLPSSGRSARSSQPPSRLL